jgi:hypothetical protein
MEQRLLGCRQLEQLTMKGQHPLGTRAYIAIVTLAAGCAGFGLWLWRLPAAGLAAFLIVGLLGTLAHAYPIQGFRFQAYQVTLPFIVLAAAMFNALELAAFIVLIHVAEQARLRRPLYIQWFNVTDYFLSASLAALIYHRAEVLLPAGAVGSLSAALAAACAFILLNRVLLAGALWLARGLSPAASGLFQPELLAADLVIAWIAGPMLVLSVEAGTWTVLVTAGPLLLARPALAVLLRRQQHNVPQAQAPAA